MAGHRTSELSSRELFGSSPDLRPLVALPYRARRVGLWAAEGSGIRWEAMVERHSAWPLLRLSASLAASDLAPIVRADGRPGRRRQAEMMRAAVGGNDRLRYCPLCARDDLDRRGEPYWHLTHQLWGVSVCPVHGVALRASGVAVSGPLRRYAAASEAGLATAEDAAGLPGDDRDDRWRRLALSRAVAWLLAGRFAGNGDVVAHLEGELRGRPADGLLLGTYGQGFLEAVLPGGEWARVRASLVVGDLTPLPPVAYALLVGATNDGLVPTQYQT